MKKQYIFLILIVIMLYIIYSILEHKYKEYNINSLINDISYENNEIKQKIYTTEQLIEYKKSKAYKNKVLKEELLLKNKGEKVVYLTSEKNYNKYTSTGSVNKSLGINNNIKNNNITDTMTIKEKRLYFLFGKDIR